MGIQGHRGTGCRWGQRWESPLPAAGVRYGRQVRDRSPVLASPRRWTPTERAPIVPSPNLALRRARERLPSSRLPGCPLSRDELASRVNAWLAEQTGKAFALDERAIGRWERGAVAMPSAPD